MNTRVHVAYCGDFTTNIGPPTSMQQLATLLNDEYEVSVTRQLEVAEQPSHNSEPKNGASHLKPNILRRLRIFYRPLSELRLLSLIIRFNISIWWKLVARKSNIVITQPFYLPIPHSNKQVVVYIRRGNAPLGVIGSERFIGRVFESIFYKTFNETLVYLVPQKDEGRTYHVIPNHFDPSAYQIRNSETAPSFHVVGTWNKRKGADRTLRLLNNLSKKYEVNVYGGLGEDTDLNESLNKSKFAYHGIREQPYRNMNCGDIFFSLSRLEGLQRSMIEAMMQGCIVVAATRPDSEYVGQSEGVFLCEWDDSNELASKIAFQQKITHLLNMSATARTRIGLANRMFAEKNFGRDSTKEKWSHLFTNQEQ